MEFVLDEEQETFRRELRRFAAHKLAPHYQEDDRLSRARPALRGELAAMGLTGLRAPEHLGGQGADCVTTGIACEEVARADFNAAYYVLNSALITDILVANGSDAQCRRFIPAIVAGERVPALCLTEPDRGSDAAQLSLRAERDGDGWRLVGEKTSVTFGTHAETALVFARTGNGGAGGVSAFYVELDDGHVSRGAFTDLGAHAIGRASLHFDGLPAGDDQMVGREGEGFVTVMKGFDYSRALIALMCVGCAQAAIDEGVEYARTREAFGQPIGTFQGVAFPLVEYTTYLHAARLLSYEALWRKDRGLPHTMEANMAKWWAPKISVEAAHQVLLTFGHYGYSEETPHGQRMRDLIGLEIGDGTANIAKLVVARALLGRRFAP
jgi:cyclohexanecarboxyl-CoA dehydrogenase